MTGNVVEIIYEGTDRATAVSKKVTRSVGDTKEAAERASQGLRKLDTTSKTLTSSLGFLAGTGGLLAVAAGMRQVINLAGEQQRVEQQLNAVIESTGGVAGITADAAKDLASSLQGVTTFGDEAIIAGQNLLLTFTNIGADVFPQATETMLDMSVALGQDLKNSAVQLGKALQDPILGVTALRRVGVNFTEEQQEMIRVMVETGRVTEAQRFILAELSTEFGGSARAAADTYTGAMQQLKNVLGDLGEVAGGVALPALTSLAQEWTGRLSALLAVNQAFQDGEIGVGKYAEILGRLVFVSRDGSEEMFILKDAMGEAKEVSTAFNQQVRTLAFGMIDTEKQVFSTSDTFQDYRTSLDEALEGTGLMINESGDLVKVHHSQGQAIERVVVANFAYTESAFTAGKASAEQGTAMIQAARGSEELADKLAQADSRAQGVAASLAEAKSQSELFASAQKRILDAGLSGALQDAFGDYKDTLAELTPEMQELQGEIDRYQSMQGQTITVTEEATASHEEYELAVLKAAEADTKAQEAKEAFDQAVGDNAENVQELKKEYLEAAVNAQNLSEKAGNLAGAMGGSTEITLDYTGRIGEAGERLAELESKASEAEAEMRRLTNQFIFNRAAADLDASAALELAESLGLIDPESAAAAQALEALREKYDLNKDGALSAAEAARGYTTDVQAIADAIASLQSREVTVTVNNILNEIVNRTIREQYESYSGEFQHGTGGQFLRVPSGFPNDTYRIGLTSGEEFMVRSPGEVQREPLAGPVAGAAATETGTLPSRQAVNFNGDVYFSFPPGTPEDHAVEFFEYISGDDDRRAMESFAGLAGRR